MLGGRMTNADEEEVEDELAALEAEMSGPSTVATAPLPSVPDTQLPERPTEQAVAPARQMLPA